MVWDICLADMMYEYVILSKDNENSESLAERILDFPRTVINPFDIFWKDEKYRSRIEINKNQQKKRLNEIIKKIYL